MKKSKVLILHESENTKIALEELGLHLLQDYSFDFLNIIDYLRVDSKQYDFIIVYSYNDYIFEYFKNKTNRIIVTVNIMKEERPSDYIKRGAENFILKPYSIKEIRLILDKLKETLSIKEEAEENKLKKSQNLKEETALNLLKAFK